MGKFDGILLCADIDGTLTDSSGKISRENSDAIKYFQQNGGLFTVATGRRPDHLKNFHGIFECNTYIIALNGALICDEKTNEAVMRFPFDGKMPEVVAEIAGKYADIDEIYVHNFFNGISTKNDGAESVNKLFSATKDPYYDIIFVQSEEMTLFLQQRLPEEYPAYTFRRSWRFGLEMFSSDAGKGNAVLNVKKLTGAKKAIAVGNYDNDIDMLRLADIGIAVASAPEKIKRAADFVTVSCDENAIKSVIEKFCE